VDVVLDGMSAFDAHERREFLLLVSAFDVFDRVGHYHAVGMPGDLLVHGVDEIEGVLGEMFFGYGTWIDPNGEELSAKISRANFVEADVSNVFGIGVADIEVLVKKTLRRIGVSIHDNG